MRRAAWVDVSLKAAKPLVAPKKPAGGGVRGEVLYAHADSRFQGVRVARSVLHVRKGSLGEKGRTTSKRFAHEWQAQAAADRLMKKLRKEGFTRRKS